MESKKISVVIPHRPMNSDIDAMLERCVQSLKGYSQLLVIVNEIGFGPACNIGVRLSHGDFVIIANNDSAMFGDWDLTDLADEDAVTFPVINGVIQEFSGAFLCIPRWVIEERGGYVYDNIYKVGYWEDVDFWWWLKQKEIPFKQNLNCGVTHPKPGSTMKMMDQTLDQKNRERFLAKNGTLPIKNWS